MKSAQFVACIAVAMVASSPSAAAAPPGFPDLNAFTPVDPQGYLGASRYLDNDDKDVGVWFSTSDGVVCSWAYFPKTMESPMGWPGITCMGNIPGIPDSVPDNGGPGCARVWPQPVSSDFVFDRHGGACPPFAGAAVLNAGQRIETGDATCVVGANQLVACVDPSRDKGFVLQPSGSWVF